MSSATFAARLEPRWTPLHAEVSVGSDGHVTNVVLLEDKLSTAVKLTVVDHVKEWKFEPVLLDGVAVPALTYVNFDTCAIPSGDGYDLAIHYVDNGPLLDRAAELEFTPAIDEYSNDHQSIKVRITVAPDGHAHLQDVLMVDVAPMVQPDIRDVIKGWVRTMRFKPEQIGGHAVATDLEWPLDLDRESIGTHHPNVDVAADPTCKLAREANKAPHSINSQLKRSDEPALPVTKPLGN